MCMVRRMGRRHSACDKEGRGRRRSLLEEQLEHYQTGSMVVAVIG